MKICEVAERCGLPVKTVRFYEDAGLVQATRRPNGYREFGDKALRMLRWIGLARTSGLTLDECRELLALYNAPKHERAAAVECINGYLDRVDRRATEVQEFRAALSALADNRRTKNRPRLPDFAQLFDTTKKSS